MAEIYNGDSATLETTHISSQEDDECKILKDDSKLISLSQSDTTEIQDKVISNDFQAIDSINEISKLGPDNKEDRSDANLEYPLDNSTLPDKVLGNNSNSELVLSEVESEVISELVEEVSSSQQESSVKLNPTELEHSSDEGSDYKDAVNPAGKNDAGSDVDSQDLSVSSLEDPSIRKRNRRSFNEEQNVVESDEESIGKDYSNEDEPPGARESGDGEEKSKEKVLDKDEDKKDPQYIPKRGMFYEHDDRTCEGGTPPPVKEEVKEKKKKFTGDKIDRWGHDMFDSGKQTPKSAQDLIDFYGYDIRHEEEAPKAWRSRRYGRGPNKYTRQWQDEAAYHSKRVLTPKPPGVFKQNEEDFPTMEESRTNMRGRRNRNSFPNQIGRGGHKPQAVRDRHESTRKSNPSPDNSIVIQSTNEHYQLPERIIPPRESRRRDIQIEKTVFLGKKKPFSAPKVKTEAEAEADIAALSKEFSNAVINLGKDGKILPIGGNGVNSTPGQIPVVEGKESMEEAVSSIPQVVHMKEKPSRQEPGNGKSKRYSSQRQRSLPQSNHIQQQQQQQPQQFIHQQQFFPPPPPAAEPESTIFQGFAGQNPPVFTEPMPGVVFLPPQFQPTPPPPHLLNFGLPPPPQQYGLPLAPPPPEMFPPPQPAGITYYSPQSQVTPRPSASRRVKVAIPIIAPPDPLNQTDL